MAERRERPFWIWSPRLTLLPAGLLSFYDFNKAGSPTPSEPREKNTDNPSLSQRTTEHLG